MPKKIRRTKAIAIPVIINRPTKEYRGYSILSDSEDNITVIAYWMTPREDGTVEMATKGVDVAAIQDIPGYDAIHTAVATESE